MSDGYMSVPRVLRANVREIDKIGVLGEIVMEVQYQEFGIGLKFESGSSIEFYSDSPIKVKSKKQKDS